MKFYICSLPLCLFLALVVFSISGSKLQNSNNGQDPQLGFYARTGTNLENPNQPQMYEQKLDKNRPYKCHSRARLFRAGAVFVTKCQFCTCQENGVIECTKVKCRHCTKYFALISTNCCIGKCPGNPFPKNDLGFERNGNNQSESYYQNLFIEDNQINKQNWK